jgi:hypothetical protein
MPPVIDTVTSTGTSARIVDGDIVTFNDGDVLIVGAGGCVVDRVDATAASLPGGVTVTELHIDAFPKVVTNTTGVFTNPYVFCIILYEPLLKILLLFII